MHSRFRHTGNYATHLTQDEVLSRIEQMLTRKSKILLFCTKQYAGAVKDNQFTLSRHKGDPWGLFTSQLKGKVQSQNGTIVSTRTTMPLVLIAFYAVLTLMTLWVLAGADQLTVNGVTRAAEITDKIIIALMTSIVPACVIFFVAILPAKKIEGTLIRNLELTELN